MKRALLLLLLLCGCHRKSAIDAGVPVAETPPDTAPAVVKLDAIDARITVDAGSQEPDASAPDAGVADVGTRTAVVEDAGAPAQPAAPTVPVTEAAWLRWDGGAAGPGGVTDFVNLSVGSTQRVMLEGPMTGIVCDDLNVVEVKALPTAYELTGKSPGVTHCKIRTMSVLGRYFEITVRP